MFKTKRKEHHHVVQTLAQMKTDVKRYKAVQMLMNQVFKVLNESRLALSSTNFVPSISPFPTDTAARERKPPLRTHTLVSPLVARIVPAARKRSVPRRLGSVLSGRLPSFLRQRSTTANSHLVVLLVRCRDRLLR